MTDRERTTLKNGTMGRQSRHKLREYLKTALPTLKEDLDAILSSEGLNVFNIERLRIWREIRDVIDSHDSELERGYASARRYSYRKIEYVIRGEGRNRKCFYYDGRERHIKLFPTTRGFGILQAGLDAKEKDSSETQKQVYKLLKMAKYPDRLTAYLATLDVQKNHRKAIRHSLELGYKFPDNQKDAKSFRDIRDFLERQQNPKRFIGRVVEKTEEERMTIKNYKPTEKELENIPPHGWSLKDLHTTTAKKLKKSATEEAERNNAISEWNN